MENFDDCFGMSNLFVQMGGSGRVAFATGVSSEIAYSFIGNTSANGPILAPVPAGTFFERLTCSGNNYGGGPVCDSLGFPNTSFTAPTSATPSQIGEIAGVLVRDNFNNFTYAQGRGPVSFSTATDLQSLTHTITIDGVDYVSDPLGGVAGGFHLLILDRTDLSVQEHDTFPSTSDAGAATKVFEAITGYKEYGSLFLLSAFGDTTYDGAFRFDWYQTSQLMGDIGGTQQVFYLVNDPENDPPARDDYTLVGFFVDQSPSGINTGLENLVGAERSSVISRETEKFPLSADMEGLLVVDNQGFFSPGATGPNLSMSSVLTAEIVSASLQGPTPWPYPGPSQAGSEAAYRWISQQFCCDDIRGAYVNLNISPSIWLSELRRLTYDPSKVPNSSQADFDAMVDQLATEFQYVTLVRLFQSNVTGLYQDQQANISLLLQQASNEVLQNLQVSLTTPAKPAAWSGILRDVFGILGAGSGLLSFADPAGPAPLVGEGVRVALSVGTLIADQVAAHTNTAAGSPLRAVENEETTAGNLAGKAADEFSNTLISLAGQFDRIVTDWGRLKTVGAPLLADQVPWDGNASGLLLQGYDRLVRREFYRQLLKTNSAVIYYPYMSDHADPQDTAYDDGNKGCSWRDDLRDNPQLLFYPSGAPNDDSEDPHGTSFPYDYQWAIWALVFADQESDSCPSNDHDAYPATFGLFASLDPGDTGALGEYRLWFYTRGGYDLNVNNDNRPCYEESC